METWKPFREGTYEVSDAGNVRRADGREKKASYSNTGYYHVSLYINKKCLCIHVHSAVAEVFIGPRPNGMQVNHKDGNKKNNRADNLEYVTRKGNMQHASAMGLLATGDRSAAHLHPEIVRRGERHWTRHKPECLARGDANGSRTKPENLKRGEDCTSSKLTATQVRNIRQDYSDGATENSLSSTYGVDRRTINYIINRKTWRHVE